MTTLSRTIAILLGVAASGVALSQTAPSQAPAPIQAPSAVQAVDPSTVAVPVNPNALQGQVPAPVQMPPPGVYSSATPPPGMVANPALANPGLAAPPMDPAAMAPPMAPVSPQAAPVSPPSSLPPLPGPNTAEVAYAQDSMLSVTPEQIRELRRLVDERQRATSELPNPPRSVTGSVSVSLSPGSTPPIIRPFIGSTSSFVVVDSTGAPWPVENFRIANPDVFPVNRLDGPHGSSFTVDTNLPYGQSNLVLKLVGVPAPVVIGLVAGQREHDARVEVRVQGRGPNSTISSGSLMAGTDARLLPVLDGMAPSGGKTLSVGGVDGVRAWLLPTGRLMVRSPVKIISPASTSFVISADGTHVYEFARTTQLLGLVDGQYVPMTVGGW